MSNKTINVPENFYKLVVKMRRAQRAYFNPSNSHQRNSNLAQAKVYERQVDEWIEALDKEIAVNARLLQLSFDESSAADNHSD